MTRVSCQRLQNVSLNPLGKFLSGSTKRKEIFLQAAAATDDSELFSALVACADEDEEDESAKTWKREASDRLYRNSVLLVGLQKLVPSLLFLLNMALYSRLLQDSEFIVGLTVSQFVLSFLAQLTKSLQAKSCNLGENKTSN